MLHFAWTIVRLMFKFAIWLVSAFFWLLYGLRIGHRWLSAYARTRNLDAGSTIRCIRSHVNETYGEWECGVCGARYVGSCWICGRAACQAVTPYIACEQCGIAIDSPFLHEVH